MKDNPDQIFVCRQLLMSGGCKNVIPGETSEATETSWNVGYSIFQNIPKYWWASFLRDHCKAPADRWNACDACDKDSIRKLIHMLFGIVGSMKLPRPCLDKAFLSAWMAHRGSELGDGWLYEKNFWKLLAQADGTINWRYGVHRFEVEQDGRFTAAIHIGTKKTVELNSILVMSNWELADNHDDLKATVKALGTALKPYLKDLFGEGWETPGRLTQQAVALSVKEYSESHPKPVPTMSEVGGDELILQRAERTRIEQLQAKAKAPRTQARAVLTLK